MMVTVNPLAVISLFMAQMPCHHEEAGMLKRDQIMAWLLIRGTPVVTSVEECELAADCLIAAGVAGSENQQQGTVYATACYPS